MFADSILEGKQGALAEICRNCRVQRLEVFGSATNDSFDPEKSDLDFLVTFELCTASQHYECYFSLVESLESLFGRAVDLVEAAAMRNPYFIQQVNESRRLVYTA